MMLENLHVIHVTPKETLLNEELPKQSVTKRTFHLTKRQLIVLKSLGIAFCMVVVSLLILAATGNLE